ncbi:Mpo1-like protein [Dokdonella sp. MW10]|uniref:Mpo1-like protein n=1 Tax=Dokdonella sp. MW10 TaxID=2992926 RepID=UPI003F7CFB15
MSQSTTSTPAAPARRYDTFRAFYPFYLSEHANTTCRRLHFVGSSLVLGIVLLAIASGNAWWLLLAPVAGYGFAWVGHFGYEKNKPASFKQPLYSFMGDWVMYWDILRGKIPF